MGVKTSKPVYNFDKERQENMNNSKQIRKQMICQRSISTIPDASLNQDIDVVFHVGQDTVMRIPACKSVLSEKNEVFHAMFYGPYSQAHNNVRHRRSGADSDSNLSQIHQPLIDQIYEPDIDGRAFKNLICFLNGETVDLRSVTTAMETLQAAEKYLCEGLMKQCVIYLSGQLTTENVLQIYQRCRFYIPTNFDQPSAPLLEEIDLEPSPMKISLENQSIANQARLNWCSYLMNSCLEFIEENASIILSSEEFEELDVESVDSIVTRDGLHLKYEAEVLTALLRWSIFECCRRQMDDTIDNRRNVLTSSQLIWQVRFLAEQTKDLWQDRTTLSQLLSAEEISLLLAYRMGQKTADHLPAHIRVHLPRMTRPRNYATPQTPLNKKQQSLSKSKCSDIPSKGSCIAEKVFICLACIFE